MSDPWWKRGSIYQIYPRSFADASGDGVGDLRGVLAQVGHLAALGTSAVWLSPFFPSPMRDFGYDVSDFCDVDPVFGTLDDLDALVDACHAADLKVVIDWVPNHCSDQHPWFQAARASRDAPEREFFVWRDEIPNDWRAEFDKSRPAWTFDEVAGQFYLHTFLPEQPELNWDSPALREAMHDTLRFWTARGVDGFRLDAIERIAKDPALQAPDGYWSWEPALTERLQGIRAAVGPDVLLVGETAMTRDPAQLAGYTQGTGMDIAMDAISVHLPWDAAAFRANSATWVRELDSWGGWVLGNHDEPRIATRLGGLPQARAAAVLLLCLRGTPFVYAGDELGLPNATVAPDRVVDPGGRDPIRAPQPWTPDPPGYGFTQAAEAWLPFVDDAGAYAVSREAGDPASTLTLYQRLHALRAAEPGLQSGDLRLLDADESGDGVVAFTRDEDRLAVAVNFTGETVTMPAVAQGGDRLVSSVAGPAGTALRPHEAVAVRRRA